MSFLFRKSIKAGPFRLNLSKSGVSVSGGVKGLRYSVNSKATTITVGSKGIYYRKRIPHSQGQERQASPRASESSDQPQTAIILTNECCLVDSNSQELLSEINNKLSLRPSWIIGSIRWGSVIVASLLILAPMPLNIILGLLVLAFGLKYAASKDLETYQDKLTILTYTLDEGQRFWYAELNSTFETLQKIHRLYQPVTQTSTDDWKNNAGASALTNFLTVALQRESPPFIDLQFTEEGTTDSVWCLTTKQKYYFLPDRILTFSNGQYGGVTYESVLLSFGCQFLIESGKAPPDAEIVEYTWQHVNKDGTRDKRNKDNQQLPVTKLGRLTLEFDRQSTLTIDCSSYTNALEFALHFQNYLNERGKLYVVNEQLKAARLESSVSLKAEFLMQELTSSFPEFQDENQLAELAKQMDAATAGYIESNSQILLEIGKQLPRYELVKAVRLFHIFAGREQNKVTDYKLPAFELPLDYEKTNTSSYKKQMGRLISNPERSANQITAPLLALARIYEVVASKNGYTFTCD